jgi:hypothetical protein
MADPKNAPKKRKSTDKNDEKQTATRAAKATWALESLARKTWAARRPTDDENMGSQKPGAGSKK